MQTLNKASCLSEIRQVLFMLWSGKNTCAILYLSVPICTLRFAQGRFAQLGTRKRHINQS